MGHGLGRCKAALDDRLQHQRLDDRHAGVALFTGSAGVGIPSGTKLRSIHTDTTSGQVKPLVRVIILAIPLKSDFSGKNFGDKCYNTVFFLFIQAIGNCMYLPFSNNDAALFHPDGVVFL